VLSEFELLRELGRGGMGQVWEARQPSLDRRVALKLLHPGTALPEAVERFAREARAGGRLTHPHIVSVYSHGRDAGVDWIAMELVEAGRTLHDLIEEQRGLEQPDADHPRRAAELVALMADALAAAHAAQVVHRDVKPRNVLLTPEGTPKLTDFGLARLQDEAGLTQTGSAAGTYAYMSPEQIKAQSAEVDHRSDVFSLGVVLYELLALQRPFEGDSFQQVMTKILLLEPVPLRQLRSRLPVELETITAKAMAKDRRHRYASMEELAADLRRFLAHEPIHARPPGRLRKARMWCRRHPVLAASGLVGTLASVVIAGLALVATGNARLAESRAAELEQVVEFQAQQFADVDVEAMGLSLRGGLREKLGELNVRRGLDAAEQEEALKAYDEQVAGADFTNLALQTLDAHVFTPALEAVEGQFGDQPLVRARLLQTLAETMQLTGLLEEAMEPQTEALEIRRRELGDEDERTLWSAAGLSSLLLARGEHAQAELLLQASLETARSTLGDESQLTLDLLDKLGGLHFSNGDLEQAERCVREALGGRQRVLGPDHADTLGSLNNVGSLLMQQGRFDAAAPYVREVLEATRRTQGDDAPSTLGALNNMGLLLIEQGELERAEPYLREALEGARRVHGSEHRSTLRSIGMLGRLFMEQRKLSEAEAYISEALAIRRSVLGDEHADTLVSISQVGELLLYMGRLPEAEEYFREELATSQRVFGELNYRTLGALNSMGVVLFHQEDYAAAEEYFGEALELQRRELGDGNRDTLLSIANLAGVLEVQGKFDEAKLLAREAVEGERQAHGGEHHLTLFARSALARLLGKAGELDEAEDIYRDVLEIRRRTLGDEDRETASSLHDLALVLYAQEKLDESESHMRESLQVRRRLLGDGHPDTLEVVAALATLLADRELFAEAALLGLELEERTRALHGERDPQVAEAWELLVLLFEAWHAAEPGAGHDADAALWRARLGR